MTALIRMAGSGRLADGSTLIWTVADGRRGRRWRATAVAAGGVTHAVLLEVGVEGRLSRLEVAHPFRRDHVPVQCRARGFGMKRKQARRRRHFQA